jgi:hypothetical protein
MIDIYIYRREKHKYSTPIEINKILKMAIKLIKYRPLSQQSLILNSLII